MNKKFCVLSVCSFALFILIELFTYYLYHFYTAEGFGFIWHTEPCKPFVTFLFGVWGTFFLFSGVISLIIAFIFNKK